MSAQELLGGEELALAKVTAGHALFLDDTVDQPGVGDTYLPYFRWPCCSCITPP